MVKNENNSWLDKSLDDVLADEAGESSGGNSKKVYIGNLSWSTSWQDLKDHMRMDGDLDVAFAKVMETPDGKSKGCGIVEYNSEKDAKRAIADLHDSMLGGRQIFVREDRGPAGFRKEGGAPPRKRERERERDRPRKRRGVTKKVYVGNLPFGTSWQDVKDHMRGPGLDPLHADILSDGCAVVEYGSVAEASKAINKYHDSFFDGRPIVVSSHEPNNSGGGFRSRRQDNGRALRSDTRSYGRQSRGGGGRGGGKRVYVGNLSWNTSWQGLKDHFRDNGYEVVYADVMQDEDGRSKGCGLVEFSNSRDAADAIESLTDSQLDGRPIFVREDREERM